MSLAVGYAGLATLLVVSSAQWWWPIVTGFFTIAGVVAAQASTFVLERQRNRHELRRQWDVDLRKAYVEFADAGLILHDRYYLSLTQGEGCAYEPWGRLNFAFEALLFLAPPDVLRAAQATTSQAHDAFMRGRETTFAELAEFMRLRYQFIETARETLGLPPSRPLRSERHSQSG